MAPEPPDTRGLQPHAHAPALASWMRQSSAHGFQARAQRRRVPCSARTPLGVGLGWNQRNVGNGANGRTALKRHFGTGRQRDGTPDA
jgi:hypothetical protein